ncbi:MAG: hypothetical protein NC305_14880 [Lachnospiraceae bacterium]|nr:hypothetical protein [Lachnospiraceae bacterium]
MEKRQFLIRCSFPSPGFYTWLVTESGDKSIGDKEFYICIDGRMEREQLEEVF